MNTDSGNAEHNLSIEIVRKLDEKRIAATVAADATSLDDLLAEELVWTHASGNSDTKAQWMTKVVGGKVKYHSIVFDETQFRAYGDTVIMNGKGSTSVLHHGGIDSFKMSITAVYAKFALNFKLVSMQVTKIP